nr:MAG TPA: hypothetical protein [Caudoviricetes sp.]
MKRYETLRKAPLLLIFLWLYRSYGKFCSVNVP